MAPLTLLRIGTAGLWLGYSMLLPSFFVLFLPFSYLWNGHSLSEAYAAVGGLPNQLLAAALLFAGVSLFRASAELRLQARKGKAPDAHTVMAQDRRPPILYLRSFSEDETQEPLNTSIPASDPISAVAALIFTRVLGSAAGAASTQEETLAKFMRRHGPLVAIGDPREDLPDLGAARLYVDDCKWQLAVLELMAKSRLVVIRPGTGQGLQWEIKQAIEKVPSEKLVLWLPRHSRVDDDSSDALECIRKLLPASVASGLPDIEPKTPCLCFGPAWTKPSLKRLQNLL